MYFSARFQNGLLKGHRKSSIKLMFTFIDPVDKQSIITLFCF